MEQAISIYDTSIYRFPIKSRITYEEKIMNKLRWISIL